MIIIEKKAILQSFIEFLKLGISSIQGPQVVAQMLIMVTLFCEKSDSDYTGFWSRSSVSKDRTVPSSV